MLPLRISMLVLSALVALAPPAVAQTRAWTPYDRPAQYSVVTDSDVPIVMRDGVTLYADVRRPDAPGRFPVLVTITPYNKLIAGEAPSSLIERGYVHVAVDVRGQGSSEGVWGNQNEIEQQDSYEVVEWAARQLWSSGKVGMWGSSYRGINQLLAAAREPPSLKAIFPIVAAADTYRDYSKFGGGPNFAFIPGWLALIIAAQNIPPGWAAEDPIGAAVDYFQHIGSITGTIVPFLADRYLTQQYDDNRVSSPYGKLDRVRVPTFLVGGLRDLFARGEPLNYEKLRSLGVPVKLLMLDGNHGETIAGIGLPADGVPTLEQIALRWFDHYLLGMNTRPDLIPNVTQMVKGDGHFEVHPTWPHPSLKPRRLYLRGGPAGLVPGTATNRRLSSSPPSAAEPEEQMAQVYLFGFCSGTTQRYLTGGVPAECAEDNTLNEQGELVYTTPVLEQDVKLSGPMAANLWIKTTRNEAVVSVRVTDVHPDGTSEELTFGLLAASFRAVDTKLSRMIAGENIQPWHAYSRDSVQPVTPGEPMLLQIEILPTNAVIKQGHALRVTIGPSNFPSYVPPVPQIENSAGGVLTLMHDPAHASHVVLPILQPTTWPPLW